MPPGIKLSKEDIERTRKMAEKDGLSAREIADFFGLSRGAILNRCRDYKIALKGSNLAGGRQGGKKTAAKRRRSKGYVDPKTLSQEERERRAAAALEAEEKRRAGVEQQLAAAAEGALHLPLVTAERVEPDGNEGRRRYVPKHYLVKGLKRTTDDEPGQCRYPMTDEPPHAFCAKRCLEGSSWCPAHHDICTGEPRIPLKALVKGMV